MQNVFSALWTSVGKKLLLALAGFGLCTFVLMHLAGNLTLFSSDPNTINRYSEHLASLGPLLYAAEIALVLTFLLHIVVAITITLNNWTARPEGYRMVRAAEGPSKKTFSSTTMIWTGLLVLVFLVVHLLNFKYGAYHVVTVDGQEIRDFHILVVQVFSNIGYVIFYTVVMLLLGFHLRHGFWSAFQTLGLAFPRLSTLIYVIGTLFAIIIAAGFLTMPIYIYLTGGAA